MVISVYSQSLGRSSNTSGEKVDMGVCTDMGRTELLASGRLGRKIAVNRSNRPVYIDSQGKRVCMHGERAGTIQGFLQAERNGQKDMRYPSTCNCVNVDGLMSSASPDLMNDGATESSPGSLFELLVVLGAEEKATHGRPQRKALGEGDNEVWVQPAGTLVCQHGNTRKALLKIKEGSSAFKRKSTVRCSCTIAVPRRVGSVFVARTARALDTQRKRVVAEEMKPNGVAVGTTEIICF